jgi:predicted FMN-binding regulatory protein PaiB
MYQPSEHAAPGDGAMLDLIACTGLATMVTVVDGAAVIDHLPFALDRTRGPLGTLEAHVARANPVWRHLEAGAPVTVVFQGPAHYLSPAWYPSKQQTGRVVPTWNYLAVHARGSARLVTEPDRLLPMLERLIAANELPLHGDAPILRRCSRPSSASRSRSPTCRAAGSWRRTKRCRTATAPPPACALPAGLARWR